MPEPIPRLPARARIDSIDLVRGLIMILMALDHTRDFFGDAAASPTNLATASAALFFTRWVTNICAPVFFLLTGTGAYLSGRRRTKADLSRFLVTRGLWLILLEFTVVRFILQFNADYTLTIPSVIWALGWAMIALGLLVWIPVKASTAFGAILMVGHNLLDGPRAAMLGRLAPIWNVLHSPGFLLNSPGHVIFQAYPVIPWIGVTAVGYGLGALYAWPAERRRTVLMRLGIALSTAFVMLRFANVYGDPQKWSGQKSELFTVLSFLNVNKYPPSLLFLLMTLGPALIMLALFDGGTPRILQPAVVIGRVPMFYYLVHFFAIHLFALAACFARYGSVQWMFQSPTLDRYPVTQPPGWPASLPVVYLVWVTVVIAVYPVCRWFADVRRRRHDWWLSYL